MHNIVYIMCACIFLSVIMSYLKFTCMHMVAYSLSECSRSIFIHACVLCVVFVPLHGAGLCDCHFRHVCLDIFGSQLRFVGELALCQLIPEAASISLCACESVCIHKRKKIIVSLELTWITKTILYITKKGMIGELVFLLSEACIHPSLVYVLVQTQVSSLLHRLCGLMMGSLASLCFSLWSVFSATAWLIGPQWPQARGRFPPLLGGESSVLTEPFLLGYDKEIHFLGEYPCCLCGWELDKKSHTSLISVQ